jgi:dethiobiotin synthetase
VTRGIFVAGTDTDVGKTIVATALLRALAQAGVRAVGMKPVAAGILPGTTENADVEALVAAASVDAPRRDVNPYALRPPIAPHLAAERAGVAIELDTIAAAYARLAMRAEVVVVEGAGGVLVPLCSRSDMLDVPRRLGIPALLVVGVRLGCLNHALLSVLAFAARGVRLAGWVANRIDPAMEEGDANVATLAARIPAPLVADLSWCPDGPPSVRTPIEALRALGLA